MEREAVAGAIGRARAFLQANPEKGFTADAMATATLERGLRATAVGPSGQTLVSDMPAGVGGDGSAPSPGWLLRAAHATCDATVIAMRAAEEGVELSTLEVTVGSDSDDRGLVGAADDVPAGPLRTTVHIRIAAPGVEADRLHAIIDWAREHSPVDDAVRRGVPVETTVEIV